MSGPVGYPCERCGYRYASYVVNGKELCFRCAAPALEARKLQMAKKR